MATQDRDLLALEKPFGDAIVTPAQLTRLFRTLPDPLAPIIQWLEMRHIEQGSVLFLITAKNRLLWMNPPRLLRNDAKKATKTEGNPNFPLWADNH